MFRSKVTYLFTSIVLVGSCSFLDHKSRLSEDADSHLREVLHIMKAHSIQKNSIDWEEFEQAVYSKASGAEKVEDVYPAIQLALKLLGDRHSLYIRNDNQFLSGELNDCQEQEVIPYQVPDDIGLVKVTSFEGQGEKAEAYATRLQESIREQDTSGLKGWIIDLRHNTGGNMWPMILGLSPLLDFGGVPFMSSDVYGYFSTGKELDADNVTPWKIVGGKVILSRDHSYKVENPYQVKNRNKKVAVLIDRMTMSAGEATAIAFKGRINTRFFGRPSCGLTTANQVFPLSNGASLALAVAYYTDRDKNVYSASIHPDEVIYAQNMVVEKAIEWLESDYQTFSH